MTDILEENDLDDIVFNVSEEPTSNVGRLAYKKKQAKARCLIYDVLYLPGLKNNLLFVAGLEGKGFRVLFMDKKVLLWAKDEELSSAVQIGVREGGLYKASEDSTHALVHHTVDPCEQWHRRFGHLHYTPLPGLQKMVTGMPEVSPKHDGICKGCALSKNTKKSFPEERIDLKAF